MTHEYPEWSALPAHDDQLALALGFDTPEMISASKNNLARLHALYQQAMRTGIVSAPYSVPAACQEPPQTDDYEQRRAQVAKRRNPQIPNAAKLECWDIGAGDTTVYTWTDGAGWHFITGEHPAAGIARAAQNLTHHDPRLGWARWMA